MQEEIESLKKTSEDNVQQLSQTKKRLEDKEEEMKSLQADSKRQLAEVYEMKWVAMMTSLHVYRGTPFLADLSWNSMICQDRLVYFASFIELKYLSIEIDII